MCKIYNRILLTMRRIVKRRSDQVAVTNIRRIKRVVDQAQIVKTTNHLLHIIIIIMIIMGILHQTELMIDLKRRRESLAEAEVTRNLQSSTIIHTESNQEKDRTHSKIMIAKRAVIRERKKVVLVIIQKISRKKEIEAEKELLLEARKTVITVAKEREEITPIQNHVLHHLLNNHHMPNQEIEEEESAQILMERGN